jgi:DNA-binding protein Fis
MNVQKANQPVVEKQVDGSSYSVVEHVLEKRLEDIVTVLNSESDTKSKLYEEILAMVDGILIRIALRRSNNIKSAAAAFLGINRNTLHNKIEKLGIHVDRE